MASQILQTPVGELDIRANESQLVSVSFRVEPQEEPNAITTQAADRLAAYFRGEEPDFSALPFVWPKGAFHARVLQTLLQTPYGTRLTYGELAALAGNPKAHRAAASAVAQNRFAIAIPCHRVIHASGGVGAYGWGPAKKAWLLHHEGVS